jgi:hypothetical protein
MLAREREKKEKMREEQIKWFYVESSTAESSTYSKQHLQEKVSHGANSTTVSYNAIAVKI